MIQRLLDGKKSSVLRIMVAELPTPPATIKPSRKLLILSCYIFCVPRRKWRSSQAYIIGYSYCWRKMWTEFGQTSVHLLVSWHKPVLVWIERVSRHGRNGGCWDREESPSSCPCCHTWGKKSAFEVFWPLHLSTFPWVLEYDVPTPLPPIVMNTVLLMAKAQAALLGALRSNNTPPGFVYMLKKGPGSSICRSLQKMSNLGLN